MDSRAEQKTKPYSIRAQADLEDGKSYTDFPINIMTSELASLSRVIKMQSLYEGQTTHLIDGISPCQQHKKGQGDGSFHKTIQEISKSN